MTILQTLRNSTRNKLAFTAGAVMGGFIPCATFSLLHAGNLNGAKYGMIAAGLAYSGLSVYEWARVAFRNQAKALAFVAIMEGTMAFSGLLWLSAIALGLLVVINATSAACALAGEKAPKVARAKKARYSKPRLVAVAQ